MRPLVLVSLVCAAAAAFAAAPAARASQLIDRNATGIELAVNAKGEALLTYRARGRLQHVLAWGAINAIAPTRTRPQVRLQLDYAGGWGKYRRPAWKSFRNACRRYDGPKLAWFVTGCKAADGTYWAIQSWQRMLPNYGLKPTPAQAVWELRLSHWRGELPKLDISLDWAYRRYDHLYGRFTYRGEGVYGFRSTPTGVPLDTFGRNIYVDTYDSQYGRGWKRENSFLAHTGSGTFCYGFYPHGARPAGNGSRYRATVIGPGVTPDIMWQASAPGPYDADADRALNDAQRELFGPSSQCRPN